MEDLYLERLLCATHYTFASHWYFGAIILQYATLTFLYVVILLLCVVWKEAAYSRPFK